MGRGRVAVVIGAVALVWVLDPSPGAATPAQEPAPEHIAALSEYVAGIDRYAALRARFEEPLPPFDDCRNAWSLQLQRLYLAAAIRSARHRATVGDIFTPRVAAFFRREIAEAIYEIDIEGLLDEDTEGPLVDLAINEPIPVWAMRPVPQALLERLAPLPVAIEYQLVGDALILWDVHAGILIDALPSAFTEP